MRYYFERLYSECRRSSGFCLHSLRSGTNGMILLVYACVLACGTRGEDMRDFVDFGVGDTMDHSE